MGLMVLIFQEGLLAEVMGFVPVGYLDGLQLVRPPHHATHMENRRWHRMRAVSFDQW
jgi:hypothetical protein